MRLIDYIAIALRNIMRQKLRSALTIFAIVIGAMSVTIMLALVTGVKDFFYAQFESSGQLQQVAVTPQTDLNYNEAENGGNNNCTDCVRLTDVMVDKIKTYPHVTGVARTTYLFVFESLAYNDKRLRVDRSDAYDPNGVIKHTFLAGREFSQDDGAGKIIITKDYADKMGFKQNYQAVIGKQVGLKTQKFFTGEGAALPDPLVQFRKCETGGCDNQGNDQQQPTTLQATIVGVAGGDETAIFFPMKWGIGLWQNRRYELTKDDQTAYNKANSAWYNSGRKGPQPVPHFTLTIDNQLTTQGYPGFTVKVDKASNTEAVAKQIRKLHVGAVTAESFITEQLKIFNIISLVLGGIGGIALLVAAIGVINTMIMSILERTREIGVMRAVGAKRSTVSWLFTIEASLLGFWGGVFGVLAGFGLIRLANVFINKQLVSNSVDAHNIIGLPLWLIASVVAITTLIGLLAGLYPARRAAKLDPVEALHYE
ncbi:MAG TPA: ABC transporter permease [Nevskiaceae bacterium]|nr:ABC transporter permease [Nevskiaceae bacterium]